MADNAAQSIKDLKSNLEALDKELFLTNKNFELIGKTISETFKEGTADIKDLYDIISSKLKAKDALKLKVIVEKEQIEKDIETINNAIKNKLGQVKIGDDVYKGSEQMKQALSEYKALLKLIPKDAASSFDFVLSTVNKIIVGSEKAFQNAVRQQSELAKQFAEAEKLREKTFGGKSYGKLSGKEKVQWTEMDTALKNIKKHMEDIEKLYPNSKAEGQRIYENAKARQDAAEAEKRAKQEAAKQEKELNKEIKDEEKTKKKDEEDYLGLLKRRNELLEKTYTLTQNLRNANLAEKSTDAFQTRSQSQISSNAETIKKLNEDIKLYEYVGIKLTAEGQQKKEEMEIAHQNKMTNIRLQGEQARQRIEERKTNKADSESKRDKKEEEKIQRQADAIVKRKIDLENKVKRIENDRAIRQQTNSNISKQALKAEGDEYTALKDRVKQLTDALAKLEGKQAGVTAKAEQNNAPYKAYIDATEEKRKAKAIEDSTKKLKEQKRALDSMLPTLQRLASAFGIAFSVRGLAQFGKKLIETRGEFERQQVALRSILQNKQLADEIWDKTMQAALQSPFTAMQLTTYTKQLAAYRIETDKLFETTKRLADVSAGLGVDMQRLILAYGQVKAANYLRASEIRQFTEAGVNVLGELRDYFNDVKGMSVDTAKVMEMVTKRLVTFEDVEAIFKRMTDQGGIFYEMQYVQSQTVRGQIAKLHDAYDQMLNSIGKANEGTLKNFVSLLNGIVKNWKEWKTLLDSVAIPALILSLYKLGKGLFTAGSAARIASKEIKGLELAGTKARASIASLDKTMKNFKLGLLKGWGGAIALFAVFEAATAIWNHAKAVKEVNEKYDELNGRLLETQYRITTYEDKIKKNNSILSDNAKSSKEQKEAQEENKKILDKLKKDYPELADGMSIANNGIIAMTNSMKEYNAELRLQILLNERAKAGFFNQSLQKDAEQFDEEIKKQQLKLANYTNDAKKLVAKVNNALESGKIGQEFMPALDALKKVAAATTVAEYEKALGEYYRTQIQTALGKEFAPEALKEKFSFFKIGGNDFKLSSIAGNRRLKSTREEIMSEIKDDYLLFGDYLREMALLSENFTGEFALTTQEFIKDNKDIIQSMLYTVKDDGTVVMGELGYALSQAFADAASVAQTEQGAQEIIDAYIQQFKEKWGLDIKFGIKKKKQEPTITNPFGDNTNKSASKLISLIREMRGEYDKLSKSAYGYAKSEEKVRESYRDSVKAILEKAGVTEDYDFTTNEGMIAALNKVLVYANKLGPEAAAEVQKYIDQLETEIEINAQVRIREDFGKQMEKAFNDYELTLELEKLNISPEAAKDWLNFDYTSLGDMLNAMNDFANKLIEKNDFDEEDAKIYQQWAKKIEDQIYKARKEKAKEYSKYLETELSERAKLEMEYAKKVAEVKASPVFQGEQQDAILNNMNREFNEKLQELTWKSFKESDFYVEMMEDLTSIPAEYSALMLTKLNEILMHPEKLSPRALKEAINARQKIMEARRQMNPALAMSENLRSYREFYTNQGNRDEFGLSAKTSRAARKEIQALIIDKSKELSQLEEEINIYDDLIGEIENYNNLKKEYDEKSQGLAGDPEEEISQRQELLECLEYEQQRYEDLRDAKQRGEEIDEEEFNSLAKEINVRQQNITQLNAEINAYREAEVARKALGTAYANLSKNAQNLVGGGEIQIGSTSGITSGNIKSKRQATSDKKDNTKSAIQRLKEARKNEVEFAKAWHEFNAQLNDTIGKVKDMGNAFYDTYEALGGETDALTEGWKEFGSTMIDAITSALTMIPTLVTGFTAAGVAINSAMGIIGLIAEAIQLVLVLITGLAKLHDAGYEAEIERQQKKIDELQRAYDRLEKSIEKTFDTASYMRDYTEMTQNLYEQIEALNKKIAEEEAKKNSDADKIQGYKDSIQDAEDELEELKQKQIEVFGGIGEDGYRDAAQEFVDAWKSAFLETGDGLQGLQDHFDEFLNDWFVKQATMRYASAALEPLFKMIDDAVDPNGPGGANVVMQELEAIKEWERVNFPQISDTIEEISRPFIGEGEGSLSGLAAGIQGMTEEQANILEAYWNSVRGYTASIDQNVATIVGLLSNSIGAGGGGGKGVDTNPQLVQLEAIAGRTNDIYRLLDGLRFNGGEGLGFRVYSY